MAKAIFAIESGYERSKKTKAQRDQSRKHAFAQSGFGLPSKKGSEAKPSDDANENQSGASDGGSESLTLAQVREKTNNPVKGDVSGRFNSMIDCSFSFID